MWVAYNRDVCVKVGYSSSNKMKSVCASQWLVVHECVCLTDVWGPPEVGRWVLSHSSEASIGLTLCVVRETP